MIEINCITPAGHTDDRDGRPRSNALAHILVVEDEEQLAALIRDQLQAAGYTVAVAADGLAALQHFESRPVDLVILDWMLPGLDGLEVCRRIRARSITPILMLTARAEEVDRVLGLEVGADDYLTKPFSMRELLARARALLRRVDLMTRQSAASAQAAEREVLELGELRVDIAGRTASVAGEPVDLTPKEFDLLTRQSAASAQAAEREVLELGELRVDIAGRTASVAGEPVDLTPKEFDL